ncbi:hypothetical protein A6779_13090 [Marinobacter adhaerens]|nr:hypothetical protein A6779_13090 [Marinobacter adhaerens]
MYGVSAINTLRGTNLTGTHHHKIVSDGRAKIHQQTTTGESTGVTPSTSRLVGPPTDGLPSSAAIAGIPNTALGRTSVGPLAIRADSEIPNAPRHPRSAVGLAPANHRGSNRYPAIGIISWKHHRSGAGAGSSPSRRQVQRFTECSNTLTLHKDFHRVRQRLFIWCTGY